jgi:hypothetical protein
MSNWFVAVNGKSLGPFTNQQILSGLASGQYNKATMVWRDGFTDWRSVGSVDGLQAGPTPHTPPPYSGQEAHQIDYTIFGNEMQYVEIELDPRRFSVMGPRPRVQGPSLTRCSARGNG